MPPPGDKLRDARWSGDDAGDVERGAKGHPAGQRWGFVEGGAQRVPFMGRGPGGNPTRIGSEAQQATQLQRRRVFGPGLAPHPLPPQAPPRPHGRPPSAPPGYRRGVGGMPTAVPRGRERVAGDLASQPAAARVAALERIANALGERHRKMY